jgi:hypothetical protein
MVLAVLTPFAALSTFALVELGTNARHDIERTIDAKVDGCMAAVEREAARHIAALQTLSATMDGDLPALRRRADAVLFRMKPDWLTVVPTNAPGGKTARYWAASWWTSPDCPSRL